MAYFAAILNMKDASKNATYRPNHLAYLEKLHAQGKIHARGPFEDGSGGMVIYIANSFEEAKHLAEQDPYIIEEVRSLDLREWSFI